MISPSEEMEFGNNFGESIEGHTSKPYYSNEFTPTQLVCIDNCQEHTRADLTTQTDPMKSARLARTPRFQAKKVFSDYKNRDPKSINSYVTVSITLFTPDYDIV